MCPDTAFCLSLVNAETPPFFSPSLWLVFCPYQAISVLYLEPKRYQAVQLALCDSILTDLQLSKQSPLFLFCSFSAQLPRPSLSLLHLSPVSSSMASSTAFYKGIFSFVYKASVSLFVFKLPNRSNSVKPDNNFLLSSLNIFSRLSAPASSQHLIRYILHNLRVSSLCANL